MAVKIKRGPKKHKAAPRTPKVNPQKKKAEASVDDHEALQLIAQAEKDLAIIEAKYADAKVAAREAKATMEKKRKRLTEIIQEMTGKVATLFSPKTINAAKGDAAGEADEAWRSTPLSALSIKKGTLNKLAEAHITTVGEYCDYVEPQANGFQPRITDIKGIKGAAVTEIEAAMDQFWTERKQAQDAAKAAAGEQVDQVAESTKLPEPSTNGKK